MPGLRHCAVMDKKCMHIPDEIISKRSLGLVSNVSVAGIMKISEDVS
jgi:hypothetical protein